MSKHFPHGCDADLEHELDGISERERHDDELCNPVTCIYCIEEREEAEHEERRRQVTLEIAHRNFNCKQGCPYCE